MTVETQTGAVSHTLMEWHAIDWQAAHENVRRLQARIVKATQMGKWGKVKALQRLLTRSHSAKVVAVKRVTENAGKNTPGVDGTIWDTPKKKLNAVYALQQIGHRPLPLRRIYIPKDLEAKKMRALSIPTMHDPAMQALYLLALEPIAETTGDPNSYGFRKERSCQDAIGQCFIVFSQERNAKWVLEGDIKACFDTISHGWLMANIPMEKAVLHKWLKAGYMEKGRLYPTQEGTPQGGIASSVLANMALDGLEKALRQRFPTTTLAGKQAKVHLIRYADDFVISGCSKELLENEVKPLVETFLAERRLQLSQEKTRITHIDTGFDFLSQNVRRYGDKLLIKPSKKSIKKLLTKVRTIVKNNKPVPAGQLIMMLNSLIRGWAHYHRHVVSKAIFARIDHEVFHAIWRWAKRRHPKKGLRWVKAKYFKRVGNRDWLFHGEYRGGYRQMYFAAGLPIMRHVKIKAEANPFDPAWELYFERRLGLKMVNSLRGRRQLIYLWKEQNGICPICQQKITKITGWQNHHIVMRSLGGADQSENRILLHPNCHRLVHSQHLHVEKPRSRKRALPKA